MTLFVMFVPLIQKYSGSQRKFSKFKIFLKNLMGETFSKNVRKSVFNFSRPNGTLY